MGFYRVSYSSNCDGTKEFSCCQRMDEKYIQLLLYHLITLFLCESGHICETAIRVTPMFCLLSSQAIKSYYIQERHLLLWPLSQFTAAKKKSASYWLTNTFCLTNKATASLMNITCQLNYESTKCEKPFSCRKLFSGILFQTF